MVIASDKQRYIPKIFHDKSVSKKIWNSVLNFKLPPHCY